MPEPTSLYVTPGPARAVVQRRLILLASLVIALLLVVIGLVGALTVQTLAAHASDLDPAVTTPVTTHLDVDLVQAPGQSLRVSAI